jgi:CIC family chloride channel protein
LRSSLLESAGAGWSSFLVMWGVAALATLVAVWMVRKISPAAGGSGIPHLKAVLLHMRRFLPLRVIFVKFFGGVLTIGAGLALGREGPTIQMGGAMGKIVGRLFGMTRDDRFILIAAGAGAGLSAAFNAPLAGLVFVLEEIQRAFHRRIFFATLLASAVADTVSRLALGQDPIFDIPNYDIPSLMGVIFNRALIGSVNLLPRLIPGKNMVVIALVTGLLVAAVGMLSPGYLGGGHVLTEEALDGTMLLGPLLGVFLIRFLLTLVSYATGAPGGIFAPLLVLGAFLGLGIALLAQGWYPVEIPNPGVFAVVGMAALFSSTVQAPLTGIVLIVEMTGQNTLMLPLLVSCLTAYVLPERLGAKPIYHTLMEREMNEYRHRVEEEAEEEHGEVTAGKI